MNQQLMNSLISERKIKALEETKRTLNVFLIFDEVHCRDPTNLFWAKN